MAITFIQKTPDTVGSDAGGGTSIQGTAFTASVTTGNYVYVFFTQYRTGATPDEPVFTDTGSNTYEIIVTATGTNNRATIARSLIATGGALRITASITNTDYHNLGCIEVSSDESLVEADTESGSGSSTAPATAQLDRTGDGIYFGLACWNSTVEITPPASWTEIHVNESWADANIDSCYYIDSGNKTPTWALASSGVWVAVSAVFYENAGGSVIPIIYSLSDSTIINGQTGINILGSNFN